MTSEDKQAIICIVVMVLIAAFGITMMVFINRENDRRAQWCEKRGWHLTMTTAAAALCTDPKTGLVYSMPNGQ